MLKRVDYLDPRDADGALEPFKSFWLAERGGFWQRVGVFLSARSQPNQTSFFMDWDGEFHYGWPFEKADRAFRGHFGDAIESETVGSAACP